MTPGDLKKCADTLGEVAMNFANMPTSDPATVQAGLTCVLAQSYLVELASHIAGGMDPFEAYEATAKGTLQLPASVGTVLKIFAAKPPK